MNHISPNFEPKPPMGQLRRHVIGDALGGKGVLISLATAAALGGLALNWNWLVTAGIAPILIVLVPCALMCGMGLCMNMMHRRSSVAEPAAGDARTLSAANTPETLGAARRAMGAACGCSDEARDTGVASKTGDAAEAATERR